MNFRMTSVTVAFLASVPSVAFAATYNVSTVAELENAVWNAAANDVIKLASGVYDLSTTTHQGTPGHLYTVNTITLEGATTNPEDTVLRGAANRILYLGGQRNTIRNLTFENGDVTAYQQQTTQVPYDYPRGGAILFNRSNSGTVSNCIFRNNRASLQGGAVAMYQSGNIKAASFTDCVFSNNVATAADAKGGAIFLAGTLAGCHFENNRLSGTTSARGGAVYNAERIENCTFTNNLAYLEGGAVFFVTNTATATPVVTGCAFTDNRSAARGSAIASDGTYGESLLVTNCIFKANAPLQDGGALNGTVANLDNVVDCKFLSNTANNGGVAHTCTLKGCLLEGNTATDYGGAAYASTLVACTNRANVAASATKVRASELAGVSSATDCVFENVGNSAKVLFDTGTTLERCRISAVDGYLFTGTFTVKNCLIADSSKCYLVYKSAADATMCNVTIVNNVFSAFKTSHACEPMVIENSFFYGNKLGKANYDIDANALGAVSAFKHCIFSAPDTVEVLGDDNLNYYGTAFNPRFVGAEESSADPYAILPGSPAAKKAGDVKDWMASTTDIRGEGYPRLRDGRVNIGCYQCWLDRQGLILYLR